MFVMDTIDSMVELSFMNHCNIESRVRIHIGNQLYDIDHIGHRTDYQHLYLHHIYNI